MIRFKLFDENIEDEEEFEKGYSIDVDFEDADDFDYWAISSLFDEHVTNFELFMDDMEAGPYDYCGIHDATGGTDEDDIEYVGYSSYEIDNFLVAIEKWKEFFRSENRLIE